MEISRAKFKKVYPKVVFSTFVETILKCLRSGAKDGLQKVDEIMMILCQVECNSNDVFENSCVLCCF